MFIFQSVDAECIAPLLLLDFFAYIYQSLCLVKYRQDYSSAIAVTVQLK